MTEGLQPFLSDAVIVLRAPTQVWSGRDGDFGDGAIDGIYHGDTRFVHESRLVYAAAGSGAWLRPETISVATHSASRVVFTSLLRGVDDASTDPKVRLERDRTVEDGLVRERLTVRSHADADLEGTIRFTFVPEFAPLQEVKAGTVAPRMPVVEVEHDVVRVACPAAAFTLSAPHATIDVDDGTDCVTVAWELDCAPDEEQTLEWWLRLDDPGLVVAGTTSTARWPAGTTGGQPALDPRLRRWIARALSDLDALRLTLPGSPDEFLAAGTPWFLTLFGRDSLWAARLLLPVDVGISASTLRVLASLQGTRKDVAAAADPGKILHELRSGELEIPGEGVSLPPVYYGSVDATPLWVCTLADAAAAGMPDDEVRALLPNLRAALDWILACGGPDGFLDYHDESGHGLSNQGWKDSGDSIQWRDGSLAQGPIALCEVQGYAYEAALSGAALLDRFGEGGGDEVRAWAAGLRERFAERFWITTDEGRYPAVALDRDGRPVDTLTSNPGHLLGTGLLDPAGEAAVAELLVGPSMSSGFGLRTMSTAAAGYWPLSYHGGSVWAHDTAIVARGMARAGCRDQALTLVEGLLTAAEAFDFRVPELHSGDGIDVTPVPVPYPAACRPQAWSAAAAIACLDIVRDR
ncbi:glycogen debranching N-terminal domain-containing protein [Microbacterium ulmi]|uniref:Amylo-alpha-1,6-glucosidase n=1 Tax=Microbacterium ulmi TaxID=179095 RepID=A0A7Y2M131_9MICO|nr:glycogen debranching N-terminal domain-containing protein [Microbacterium ulmi]NII68327.1 hypothetical protein [Microbacterium ulmi]NNH03138.1 amylo-alpha-1,6-glucosidase [Microbacterium ulmi]